MDVIDGPVFLLLKMLFQTLTPLHLVWQLPARVTDEDAQDGATLAFTSDRLEEDSYDTMISNIIT